MFSVYPTIRQYLAGATSSGLFEAKLGAEEMKWVNFGGGHHITREDYDREAIAYYAGYLVASVLDIVHNGMDIALLQKDGSKEVIRSFGYKDFKERLS